MTKRAVLLAAASLGALVGVAVAGAALGGGIAPAPAFEEPVDPTFDAAPRVDGPAPSAETLLVWTAGGFPDGFEAGVQALDEVAGVTAVRMDLVDLSSSTGADGVAVDRPPGDLVTPLEAMAFDRATYPAFLPAAVRDDFEHLADGDAILGTTSARLRGIGPGGRLLLANGEVLTVAAVVDDTLVGAAELAVSLETASGLGVDEARYLLVAHDDDRSAVERAVRAMLPAGRAARIRAPAETPFLRHGDAVLPQVLIKERFGEFAYRPTVGGTFGVDAAWEAEHLVTTELPLVGRVRCHRQLIAPLTGAFRELRERNLAYLVRPDGFAGCWNPRFIATGAGISRHAWGAAVDLNAGKNPTGLASVQDPRLVEVMERWGFTWGGRWLVPDAAHFEYLRPPS